MRVIVEINKCPAIGIYRKRLIPVRQKNLYLTDVHLPLHRCIRIFGHIYGHRLVFIIPFQSQWPWREWHPPVKISSEAGCISEFSCINITCSKNYHSFFAFQFRRFLSRSGHGNIRLFRISRGNAELAWTRIRRIPYRIWRIQIRHPVFIALIPIVKIHIMEDFRTFRSEGNFLGFSVFRRNCPEYIFRLRLESGNGSRISSGGSIRCNGRGMYVCPWRFRRLSVLESQALRHGRGKPFSVQRGKHCPRICWNGFSFYSWLNHEFKVQFLESTVLVHCKNGNRSASHRLSGNICGNIYRGLSRSWWNGRCHYTGFSKPGYIIRRSIH